MLFFMANKTVLGGFIGGLVGVELTKKAINVHTSSGDLMVFPILLGLIIGRIGCHLEGLEDGTFGKPTTLPWGIDFGDGIARHPTNLYEIIFLIILWLSIIYIEKEAYTQTAEHEKKSIGGKLFFLIKIFNFYQKKQLTSNRFFLMYGRSFFDIID